MPDNGPCQNSSYGEIWNEIIQKLKGGKKEKNIWKKEKCYKGALIPYSQLLELTIEEQVLPGNESA